MIFENIDVKNSNAQTLIMFHTYKILHWWYNIIREHIHSETLIRIREFFKDWKRSVDENVNGKEKLEEEKKFWKNSKKANK